MAFLRKVPTKLEGVLAIEQFILEQVKPHIKNLGLLKSVDFSKKILKDGLKNGTFTDSHTHQGIRSYINRIRGAGKHLNAQAFSFQMLLDQGLL